MTVLRKRSTGFLVAVSLPLILVYLFTANYIIQFAAMFLMLILLGAKTYSEYLIRNIVIVRRDAELREFRFEWVTIELLAENRGKLPAFLLAVSDSPGMLPVFRDNKVLCTLQGRSRIVFQWRGYCSSRGIFDLGPATLRGADPLRLFPFTVTPSAKDHTKLFVYPTTALAQIKSPGGIPLGTLVTSNPLYEDLTRSRSIRDYQRGDEPRRINWKVSARTGNLMVNEFESTISYPLMVFLNLAPEEYSLRTRELYLERAIEAAAACCLMASRERQEVGIILYTPTSDDPLSVIAPAAFTLIAIMERLAGLTWSAAHDEPEQRGKRSARPVDATVTLRGSTRAALEQGKYLPYGTRLMYTGPDLADEDYMALNTLKAYHVSLEYLIIDETSLSAIVPGNSRRYQLKESGYEIL
ncbi:hypothetical protein FACS189483_10100 [Spirochaetia bacterium]|nr:hypothetical protein FACS189483_10100 [Spirochaetia bacterium]